MAAASYLVLAERVLLKQVLVAAADLEDVLALVLLHAHAQLLRRQVHAARLLADGLGNELLGQAVVADLQRVLLLGVGRRHDHPDGDDQATCRREGRGREGEREKVGLEGE